MVFRHHSTNQTPYRNRLDEMEFLSSEQVRIVVDELNLLVTPSLRLGVNIIVIKDQIEWLLITVQGPFRFDAIPLAVPAPSIMAMSPR